MTLPKPVYRVRKDEICIVWINTTSVAPAEAREIARWCRDRGAECSQHFLKYLGDPLLTFAEARRICGSRYMVLIALVPLRAAMELVKLCRDTGVCEVWQPRTELVKVCRSYEECSRVAERVGDSAIVAKKGRHYVVRRFIRFAKLKNAVLEEETI